jgi:hypothetical protein
VRTEFDPSLLNMQAPNLESVKLVDKLQTWSAVVLSHDLDTLRAARDAVKDSPQVKRTESILIAYDNLAWLKAHEHELPAVNWSEPAPVTRGDLKQIAQKARALADHFNRPATAPATVPATNAATQQGDDFADARRSLREFADKLDAATAAAGDAAADQVATRLTAWQHAFVEQIRQSLAPFHPGPLDLAALPPELKSHYVGTDGSFALYIYPSTNLWDQTNLRDFVKDVEHRIERVPGQRTLTGIAINIYHSTSSIERSFYKATFYALGLIVVLVLIDLRSVTQTLLAVSVLALGLPMLIALMGLFGENWNFANFFGLPILIGAGHEYGVFLVHRYREALHEPRRVWRRWDVSDKALLLCAYITSGSFGFFWMLAHHHGLRSLGLVMALGTLCIYLAAVAVLRPLLIRRLAVRRERRRKA